MDRVQRLLSMIDLSGNGLEIGPGYNPLLRKSDGYRIETLDHGTAEQIREKYKDDRTVDISNIEDVDHVWDGRPIAEVVGKYENYDYIVASHVIEHTTDFIGFLQECQKLLRPDGILLLAVPDKRRCFDVLQPITTVGAVLQANLEKRTSHPPGLVFDYVAYNMLRDGKGGWPKGSNEQLAFAGTLESAWDIYLQAKSSHDYIDAHAWRFTPSSFRIIIEDLYKIGLIKLREVAFHESDIHEFYVTLSRNGNGCPLDRLTLARQSLRELNEIVADTPSRAGSPEARIDELRNAVAEINNRCDGIATEMSAYHARTDRLADDIDASRAQVEKVEAQVSRLGTDLSQVYDDSSRSRSATHGNLAPGRRRAPKMSSILTLPKYLLRRNSDGRSRESGDIKLIASSDIFDKDWYLFNYIDVAQAGVDPIKHYLRDGAAEGRDPGPSFSTLAYLKQNPAVQAAGVNPLVHYLKHGRSEAASAGGPSDEYTLLAAAELFDSAWYLRENSDVARAGVDPILHYLQSGFAEGRDPGPNFSTRAYLERYPAVRETGVNPLVHYLRRGKAEGFLISSLSQEWPADVILDKRFHDQRPLPIFGLQAAEPRVVMVTDSINAGSLYGGVGTSLILSALLARRLGRPLCIVTRTESADQANVAHVLGIHDVRSPKNIEFAFVPSDDGTMLPTCDEDIFITTSWWVTRSALRSLPPRQIVYLLQEDERMFYAHGDDHLRCSEQLANDEIRYVVNSQLLYEHFKHNDLSNIERRGVFFEPCFPASIYFIIEGDRKKFRFMFYARPHNQRNLYYRGLEALSLAIQKNILDADEWDFHFIGKNLKPMSIVEGVVPILHQNMEWSDYADLIRETDLALSLMYTPHPSYPPLDVVASGGVAVTNRYGNKLSLEQYSRNLLCVDTGMQSILDGLERAVRLVKDTAQRRRNYEEQTIQRDWAVALDPVLDFIISE